MFNPPSGWSSLHNARSLCLTGVGVKQLLKSQEIHGAEGPWPSCTEMASWQCEHRKVLIEWFRARGREGGGRGARDSEEGSAEWLLHCTPRALTPRRCTYVAVLVQFVVGEFHLFKRHHLFEELLTRERRVWVHVQPERSGRVHWGIF